MLEMRPNCECCDVDLPADVAGAWVCSFECTFCASCAMGALAGRCPNCGGGLAERPLRMGDALARHPASATRVVATRKASTAATTGDTGAPAVAASPGVPRRVAAIRALRVEDRDAWLALWQGYLAFYGAVLPSSTTEATWQRLLGGDSPMFARVAVAGDGMLLGFAHALPHEGSWTTTPQCYLEDLFVAPEARGSGAGRALIDDLVALCRERGWSRLYWHTQAGNGVARRLYDRVARADDMVRYRIIL